MHWTVLAQVMVHSEHQKEKAGFCICGKGNSTLYWIIESLNTDDVVDKIKQNHIS